jgi:hypothetical protein
MKIAFDVDGVVLKSIDVILDYINRVEGRDLRPDQLTGWELEPLGLSMETVSEAVEYLYSRPRVDAYSGATETLSRIHRATQEPLLFITGRADPRTALRQLEALPWNPTVPEMIVSGGQRDKRQYLARNAVDLIVEDDVKYIGEYSEAGFRVGLMVRPWNRATELPVAERFESWNEVDYWFRRDWKAQ